MELTVRPLSRTEQAPYDLLLLADPSKQLVDDYLSRGQCFLATTDDEAVGVFVLLRTHPLTVEIVNIAVKQELQGRGLGRTLIQKAIEEARKLNARSIEIGTGNSSLKQLGLYQRCGFSICGIDFGFFIRNYDEPIFEDGIPCKDMIRLRMDL